MPTGTLEKLASVSGTIMPAEARRRLKDLLPDGQKLNQEEIVLLWASAQNGTDAPPEARDRVLEYLSIREYRELMEELAS